MFMIFCNNFENYRTVINSRNIFGLQNFLSYIYFSLLTSVRVTRFFFFMYDQKIQNAETKYLF